MMAATQTVGVTGLLLPLRVVAAAVRRRGERSSVGRPRCFLLDIDRSTARRPPPHIWMIDYLGWRASGPCLPSSSPYPYPIPHLSDSPYIIQRMEEINVERTQTFLDYDTPLGRAIQPNGVDLCLWCLHLPSLYISPAPRLPARACVRALAVTTPSRSHRRADQSRPTAPPRCRADRGDE